MRSWLVTSGLLLIACVGPEAPDAALCTDLIGRLCMPALCDGVDSLSPGDDCQTTLLTRTGCKDEAFTFATTNITRDRFIECRATVVDTNLSPNSHPDCHDVSQFFSQCSDVTTFLGAPP